MRSTLYSLYRPLCVLLLAELLLSCQSKPILEFETVVLGQDKSDVLEAVGGPSWSDRRKGMDRWAYILYQDGVRLERHIYFLDGIVAYKGEPNPPFISAEEQDEINLEKNLALDSVKRPLNSTPLDLSGSSQRNPNPSAPLGNSNPQ